MSTNPEKPVLPLRAVALPCGEHYVVEDATGLRLSTQCTKALADAIVHDSNQTLRLVEALKSVEEWAVYAPEMPVGPSRRLQVVLENVRTALSAHAGGGA